MDYENTTYNENNSNVKEISTDDFAAMFNGDAVFADEQPKQEATDDMSGFSLTDDMNDEIDFDNIYEPDVFDDLSDVPESESLNDLIEAHELDAPISINGVRYEREQVEKALNMHSNLDGFSAAINSTMTELDNYADEVDKFYQIAVGEHNETINYYQSILDNERADAVTRTEAYKEIQKANMNRRLLEEQYSKVHSESQAKKQRVEKLKGEAVANELLSMGWKQSDFITTTEYMRNCGVIVPYSILSPSIMIALKKAAMFDNKEKANIEKASSSVQRAIAGKPARQSAGITPDDARKKAKAKQLAAKGELSAADMFNYLDD